MKKIISILSLSLCFFNYSAQTTHTVNVGSYYYTPTNLTVQVGDSVIWINDGGFHDVNGNINSITNQPFNNPVTFDSPSTNTVGAVIFAYKFTVPGIYNYDCSVGSHAANGMVGIVTVNATSNSNSELALKGVLDLHGSSNPIYSGTDGKAIHLIALADITDLSIYSLDVVSNGSLASNNGPPNPAEYVLSGSALAGDNILIYRVGSGPNSVTFFSDYFGSCYSEFDMTIPSGSGFPSGNGDDPVALFMNNNLVDSLTYSGNPIMSGAFSGDPYDDSWAHRDSTGTWQFGGKDCDIDGTYSVDSSSCPYPICGLGQATPPTNFNVTLSVNASHIIVGSNGMYAGGGILGGANAVPLSDPDGDSIWTGVALIDSGANGNYAFFNSPSNGNDWSTKEDLDGLPCAYGQFNDRSLPPINGDTILLHCFGTCDTDGTCQPPLPPIAQSLNFTAIMALSVQFITTSPSAGKALMLTANQNISDLSTYGFGCANNGVGSQGEEYTFPNISINAGQHIIVCRDSLALSTYFDGCLEQFPGSLYPNLIIESSGEPTGNGNDAYELFFNGSVIETFGDINHNYGIGGFTDLPWAYRYSWAWKDTAASNVGNWVYGGDNCSDSSTTTQTSSCSFPLCEATPTNIVSTISNDILIYPNPSNNILNISSHSKIMYLEIYNSLGQKVFERSLMSLQVNLDVSSFSNDFYIAKVVFEDKVSIVNFIKN